MISEYEMHRPVCKIKQMMRQIGIRKKNAGHLSLNVKENIIKALDDLLFHLLNCCHMPYLLL
jgi:hypothetical protein